MAVPDDLHEQANLLADLVFGIAPTQPTREDPTDAGVLLLDGLGGIWLMPGQVEARSLHTRRGPTKDVASWPFQADDHESLLRAVRHAVDFLRAAAPQP